MPPIGDNLVSRTAAIVLGSFAAFALLVAIVVLRPSPRQVGPALFQLPLPQDTAAIVEAVEATPPQNRPLVVKALNNSVTGVHLEPAFPPIPRGLYRAPKTEPLFNDYGRLLGERAVRVELKPTLPLRFLGLRGRGDQGPPVEMMVALKTGGVLVIEHRAPLLIRGRIGRLVILMAAAALIASAGLALAVRQTSRPVRQLADAARRFSLSQATPSLPVRGPQEVRELSTAFNDLHGRIRDLVAERTHLLAAIAHDLRTYLTRLRLRTDFIDDVDQRHRTERDLDEMSKLLDDSLAFARHAEGPAARLETCDAWREVQGLTQERSEIGEPVRLSRAQLGNEPLLLHCSSTSLRRMLNNLMDNAIRYGDEAQVSVRSSRAGVEIVVEDHGPGVPPGALATLARPFVRLESSRMRETGGAGLGLAIVKSLAEGCGGSLELHNAPAGGLVAVLRFPATNVRS